MVIKFVCHSKRREKLRFSLAICTRLSVCFLLACGRVSAQASLPTDTVFFSVNGAYNKDSIAIYINHGHAFGCYLGFKDWYEEETLHPENARAIRRMPLLVPSADSVDIRVDFYENLNRYWFLMYDLNRCTISDEATIAKYAPHPTQSIMLRVPLSRKHTDVLILYARQGKSGLLYEYHQYKKSPR